MKKEKTCHDVLPGDINATEEEKKIHALSQAIDITTEEATELIDSGDYMVLTDEEAEEAAAQYIKDSLWAFNASFIIGECGLDYSLEPMIQAWQEKECENANDGILSLIENSPDGIEGFIESAISADGKGHFLSSYDGNEIEQEGYFIYRIN